MSGEKEESQTRPKTHKMRSVAILDSFSSTDECAIGPAQEWPVGLQDTTAFILSVSYPAAVFLGTELVILHNEAWGEMLGISLKQAKPQHDVLSAKAKEMLRSAIDGQAKPGLTVTDLVGEPRSSVSNAPVLCSPLVCGEMKCAVLQILSQHSDLERSSNKKDKFVSRPELTDDQERSERATEQDTPDEDLALDRQPFFQKFAEMLPTGLAILDHRAEAMFVNRRFHELTVHGGTDKSFNKWPKTIHPDDFDRVMKAYHEAFEARTNLSTEFRSYGMNEPWRLFMMRPLGGKTLQHPNLSRYAGFICAVVDITNIKAAEIFQSKAAREAQERKQQQERFIDMISHEIRNPLSAVLHCTEDILEAVDYGRVKTDALSVDDIVEACDTISICVGHQKTLVDDVLSFSKLDASMLSLVPKPTRPKWQMSESLKIFQPELRKREIKFDYKMDPSYAKHDVEWVLSDLVRISQVLVNLMSNAIKFTANKDGTKMISVDVGATDKRPTSYPPDVVFFESDEKVHSMDSTRGNEWGNGEALYILVAIRDTGIGINNENQEKLFDRFRQATPKTEEMYGGSGLGLNISRKICQLHGGEIGVSSKEGYGSTFGFFFRVRRCEDPPAEDDRMDPQELRNNLHVPKDVNREPVKEGDSLEVLRKPRTEEATNDDNRWQNTAEVVSNLDGTPKTDEKGNITEKHQGDKPESPKKSTTNLPSRPKVQGPSVKVLLVEDNLINQRIVKRKLQARGFEVITANNGKEAVEAFKTAADTEAKAKAFIRVLMDQEMPVLDGNAATKYIREFETEKSLSRTHIVGVTANVRDEQQTEMKNAGMDSVLSKPFKIDELVERIRSVAKPANEKP